MLESLQIWSKVERDRFILFIPRCTGDRWSVCSEQCKVVERVIASCIHAHTNYFTRWLL